MKYKKLMSVIMHKYLVKTIIPRKIQLENFRNSMGILKFKIFFFCSLSESGQGLWTNAWALTEADQASRSYQALVNNMYRTSRCPRSRVETFPGVRSLDSLSSLLRLPVRLSTCWVGLLVLLGILAEMTGEAVSSAAVGATAASGHHYQVSFKVYLL